MNKEFGDLCARIKKMKNNPNDFREMELIVNYAKTVEQAVAASHLYFVDKRITSEDFPVDQEKLGTTEKIVIKLFPALRNISSKDAVALMAESGFRPATVMELAALAFSHPRLQRYYFIVALGSSIFDAKYNDFFVPCLRSCASGREMGLVKSDYPWGLNWGNIEFLGVKLETNN